MFFSYFPLQDARMRWAVLSVAGAALMGWLSPMVWRVEGALPITPQSLVIVVWAVLWGWRSGTAAVLLYLAAGGMGAPVFAGGAHGWVHFTGSTAGFLYAFPISALVVGFLAEQVRRWNYAGAAGLLLLGHAVLLGLGLFWQRSMIPVEDSLAQTLSNLLPSVLVKTALGTLVVVVVGRALTQHRKG